MTPFERHMAKGLEQFWLDCPKDVPAGVLAMFGGDAEKMMARVTGLFSIEPLSR